MMPLVRLHDLATCELAVRVGGSRAGLLNASLSNIVELVIATTALRKCELRIVQSSLIGSILSKLREWIRCFVIPGPPTMGCIVLVLGMCFFGGGLQFTEQGFDATATQIHSSLLSISVGAVLMPAAYHFSLSGGTGTASTEQKSDILKMSHGVAVILLAIYCAYLLFQLWSHTYLFKDPRRKSSRHTMKHVPHLPHACSGSISTLDKLDRASSRSSSPESLAKSSSNLPSLSYQRSFSSAHSMSPYSSASDISLPSTGSGSSTAYVYSKGNATPAPPLGSTVKLVREGWHGHMGGPATELPSDAGGSAFTVAHEREEVEVQHIEVQEPEKPGALAQVEPRLSWPMTLSLLVVVTVLVAVNAEWLVESMGNISTEDISKEWIALILLPTVSCIAECVTAINVSVKDQLTLSTSVAVGSTIQTALFVIPLMVVLGWILDKPLAMLFDPFESVVLYISVSTMGYVVADGKSNWLEGLILICLYLIIAVSFFFYPGSTFSSTLAVCASDPRA
ncbi:hypothetical protein BV25DRAFT_187641 [Artomyces pyxidatus]|uniref:Uncharacterized protein n=1 Tax=Artomyces pyxidatus TaxID=48021 RepID=A0ACB8T8H4_9AGAM|nr:hypothetical protein BV25DRAFT_187641 [Artomyces pyxidatus]